MATELFTARTNIQIICLSLNGLEDMFSPPSPPPFPLEEWKEFPIQTDKNPADNSSVAFSPVNAPLPTAGRKATGNFHRHFPAEPSALRPTHFLAAPHGRRGGQRAGPGPRSPTRPEGPRAVTGGPEAGGSGELKMAMQRGSERQPVIRKVIQSH